MKLICGLAMLLIALSAGIGISDSVIQKFSPAVSNKERIATLEEKVELLEAQMKAVFPVAKLPEGTYLKKVDMPGGKHRYEARAIQTWTVQNMYGAGTQVKDEQGNEVVSDLNSYWVRIKALEIADKRGIIVKLVNIPDEIDMIEDPLVKETKENLKYEDLVIPAGD